MSGVASSGFSVVGRYALYEKKIAAGGMASVHLGRLAGAVGFSRTVAIKRLHQHLAAHPDFVAMFVDEARLAARIRHPNVVPTLDVVSAAGELFLVMEYVAGESLSRLLRASGPPPLPILSAIMAGVLYGLDAAHEAKDEQGRPLGIVHRDVSPQNILVGTDGVAKLVDFGVAKAAGRAQSTHVGQVKGKLSYIAPEQLRSGTLTRHVDVYGAGVVLWEAMTGKRLFVGDSDGAVLTKILHAPIPSPSQFMAFDARTTLRDETYRGTNRFEAAVMRALDREPTNRFQTAREMARELERAVPPATASEVGEWIEKVAGSVLAKRAEFVAEVESRSALLDDRPPAAPALNARARQELLARTVPEPSPPEPASPEPASPEPASPEPAAGAANTVPSTTSAVAAEVSPPPAPSRRKAAVWVVVTCAGLALGTLIAAAASYRPAPAGGPGVRSTVAAMVSAPASPTLPGSPPATPVPSAHASASAVDLPLTNAPGDTAPKGIIAPREAGVVRRGPGARHAAASASASSSAPPVVAPTPDCTIPFYYDEANVKRFREECL